MSWKSERERLKDEGRWEEYKRVAREAVDKYGELAEGAMWELLKSQFEPLSRQEKIERRREAEGIGSVFGNRETVNGHKQAPPKPPPEKKGAIAKVSREQKIGLVEAGHWDENYPERDAIRWVLDHLSIEEMRPEDAPCAFAWTQYAHFSSTHKLRGEYLTLFGSKFVPTRSQLEGEGKYKDDGRPLEDLISEHLNLLGEGEE